MAKKSGLNGSAPKASAPDSLLGDDIQVQVLGDKVVLVIPILVIPIGLVMAPARARAIGEALSRAAGAADAAQKRN
jgi:hypothetical protein